MLRPHRVLRVSAPYPSRTQCSGEDFDENGDQRLCLAVLSSGDGEHPSIVGSCAASECIIVEDSCLTGCTRAQGCWCSKANVQRRDQSTLPCPSFEKATLRNAASVIMSLTSAQPRARRTASRTEEVWRVVCRVVSRQPSPYPCAVMSGRTLVRPAPGAAALFVIIQYLNEKSPA